jgi:hypothetical protein
VPPTWGNEGDGARDGPVLVAEAEVTVVADGDGCALSQAPSVATSTTPKAAPVHD